MKKFLLILCIIGSSAIFAQNYHFIQKIKGNQAINISSDILASQTIDSIIKKYQIIDRVTGEFTEYITNYLQKRSAQESSKTIVVHAALFARSYYLNIIPHSHSKMGFFDYAFWNGRDNDGYLESVSNGVHQIEIIESANLYYRPRVRRHSSGYYQLVIKLK